MTHAEQIKNALDSPEQLESLFQKARHAGKEDSFRADLIAAYRERPDHILLSAWYHRLLSADAAAIPEEEPGRPWARAVAIGLLTGLAVWALSDPALILIDEIPYLALLWSPIAAVGAMAFLVWSDTRRLRRAALCTLALVTASVYVLLVGLIEPATAGQNYLILMAIHLPLLSFAAVGVTIVGTREDPLNRFAFLSKSLEVFVSGGLFAITGVIALQISYGMFETQGLDIPEWTVRLIVSLAAGTLPLLAIVSSYDPSLEPSEQDFRTGLSRLIATILHVVLPVVCTIMVVYTLFIPFSFWGPFENRDVLIIYNVMLFAIMALLVGVVPVQPGLQSERVMTLVRRGIFVVSGLAALIGIYALSAVVYRTVAGGITPNRLTVIGWNVINILTLVLLTVRQMRTNRERWTEVIHHAFSKAAYAYIAWGIFVVLSISLLFRS